MIKGHFIASLQGKLFITQFGDNHTGTAILCLPSITEELNLSRAIIAKQAQQFTLHHLPCFVLDYFGTGDSEGEFEQASCDIWLENILVAGQWLHDQGYSKIILWGVRFGALLMLANQQKIHHQLFISQQVLWKPVLKGVQFAGQFLRIKQANSLFNACGDKMPVQINWRQHILDGNDTQVAGYCMTRYMLSSWEALDASATNMPLSPVYWLELAAKQLSPASRKLLQTWPAQHTVSACFDCPAFWQIPAIFTLPALYQLTLDAVLEGQTHG